MPARAATRVLAQQGWQVTAVDFSPVGLAKAFQLAAADVEVATVCADVAHYMPNPGGFELVAVLSVHLPAGLRTDGHGGPQDPDVLFSPGHVAAYIVGSGLVVDRADRVHRTVGTADGERVAIDAVVRAQRPGQR